MEVNNNNSNTPALPSSTLPTCLPQPDLKSVPTTQKAFNREISELSSVLETGVRHGLDVTLPYTCIPFPLRPCGRDRPSSTETAGQEHTALWRTVLSQEPGRTHLWFQATLHGSCQAVPEMSVGPM